MNTQELCPLCGEGHVTAQVEQVENEYKGKSALLPQHFKQCDHCGSDFAGAAEAKLNKRALMAWRKAVDGLLTGAEIIALRHQYNLTQAQAAQLFGGGPVAFSKYENDDVAQSEAMDTLLRLVRRSPEAFRALQEEKGLHVEAAEQANAAQRPALQLVATREYHIERQRDEQSPRYDPRPFRKFKSQGDATWKQ
ncbi:type II toxin-antitoxin system MqsA family antitoxin [Aquabacterium sp.]|uniref:type II toxin-antitoxin system MqsA family antitoxin n=1 Tax=Aquabacterium sp. TaxID=1872578 RepID=UPI004037E215